MAPVPVDGPQTPLPPGGMPPSAPSPGGNSISLGLLVDFILQRTYHELTVLAELLPRKTDMERKIEIVQFANRTRQLFVRLLALVKWANSASKVDKCVSIMGFLDKQSMFFVETADMMARMARETLVHARLPNFQLPCAVEVLTTGSYIRLPTCIRDRILFHDPITSQERLSTLQRLEQIIQHRLVTSVDLPPQMRNLRIENGRVTFHVEQEFEVSLTLMGDTTTIPWRLLDIVFLVEDKETGDGRSLVHSLQVRYIIDLIQSRLLDNPTPLFDLYNCLHSFSQSLQLEVLYSQVYRLCRERLGDFIRIEEYVPGKCLTVIFWRELTEKSGVDYKLCVQVDNQDTGKPLQLIHTPTLSGQELQQADQAIKSDLLSCERLLVQTIYVRTKQRLNELKEEIKGLLNWDIDSSVNGSPAVLNIPILQPCLRSEQILITVDTHLGTFLAHVPQYADAPYVDDIRQTLNGDRSKFCSLISELKFWIVLQRSRKSVQHLPAVAVDKLPVIYSADHPMAKLSKHKLYIKMCKHPYSYLVVELRDKSDSPFEVEEIFHLLILNPRTFEEADGDALAATNQLGQPGTNSGIGGGSSAGGSGGASSSGGGGSGPNLTDIKADPDGGDGGGPRLFYTVQSLVQFDTFAVTHGPYTKVDGEVSSELCRALLIGKRKSPGGSGPTRTGGDSSLAGGGASTSASAASKRPKHPAYFLPELAHVVAMVDERIPFAALAEELGKRGLCHQGLQVDAGGAGLSLRLVQMPPCRGLDAETTKALRVALLGCTIRMIGRGSKTWLVEYAFCKCPLVSTAPKDQGPRRQVYFVYDVAAATTTAKTVDDFISDWTSVAFLYSVVLGYAKALKSDSHGTLSGIAEVKNYSYRRLTLGYGSNRANTISMSWRASDNRFSLTFGIVGQTSSAVNPHTLTAAQLQHYFNRHQSIASLLRLLRDTYLPLVSVAKLNTVPMSAIIYSRPQVQVQTFTVIPRSPSHFRISFRNTYCLDVHCRGEGTVAVRDGAYSLFDKSKAVEEFIPTQGLKAFLNKFVDDSVGLLRRRSQSEDDNPPSPISTGDPLDTFLSGHPKPGSPAQQQGRGGSADVSGLRFHHPNTPGSNPHTPASPHPSSVLPYGSSPGASFSLASPPSLPHSINPHMTPSPGSLLAANSPGGMHVPSPGSFLPQPSPQPQAHLQSPASAPYGSGGHDAGGSPYPGGATPGGGLNIASPANAQWPGSPSIPRPSPAGGRGYGSAQSPGGHQALHSPQSVGGEHKPHASTSSNTSFYLRVLPQRSWAAAVPTVLSEAAFDVLCTPAALPGVPVPPGTTLVHCSPLERFLGCVYTRRFLQRFIQSEDFLINVPCNEIGVIMFRVETVQARVTINPVNFQTLHLKLTPTQDYKDNWSMDEMQVLERFFELKVVCPPYKSNALLAFTRILNAPIRILKDCIQIMRLEMYCDRTMKWAVQWCLTISPASPPIAPPGMAAVVLARNKLLFFIQLTRFGLSFPPGTEPQTVVLPIVYDINSNTTQLADRQQGSLPPTSATAVISNSLRRFAEFHTNRPGECSIFPAVRELMINLVIPV